MPPKDIINNPSKVEEWKRTARTMLQRYLDASVPHRSMRWALFVMLLILYVGRVAIHGGYYVLTYSMSIQLLAQCIPLITPLYNMEEESSTTGGGLPTTQLDMEFKPFIGQVSEFVAWKVMVMVVAVHFFLSLFSFTDIPVFWPILVIYFFLLVAAQMGPRIKHMIKHGYVPWTSGKPKFVPKKQNV